MCGTAIMSADGKYRYLLTRDIVNNKPKRVITWIMLNPSTADAIKDDQTIRRVISFTKLFGGTSLQVINLFAFRATNPKKLPTGKSEAMGPEWERWITNALYESDILIAAWGSSIEKTKLSAEHIKTIIGDHPIFCLGITKSGSPRHPLYMHSKSYLIPFAL